jgi:aspartyl-tRNA synthetase
MQRTHYSRELDAKMDGANVTIGGWVDNVRILGGIAFVTVRDKEGVTQVTLPKKKVGALFDVLKDLTKESVVAVRGQLKASKEAPNGIEIIPTELHVLSKAHTPLPMDVSGKIESELETRLDARFMDLRQPKVAAIFSIRDQVFTAVRNYMEDAGFVEVHTPKIVAEGAEGGSSLFKVDYFGKKAFLAQSPQLFKQALMATGLDRVYEIGPAFRAEESNTTRHISEFSSFDFEQSFIDSQEDVMTTLEECVASVISHVIKEEADSLKILGVELKAPSLPFPRITFTEVQKLLEKEGKRVPADLDTESERALGDIMAKEGKELYFVTEFPEEIKPFYIMEKGNASCSFDLDYRGQELASGGQREHRYDTLVARMEKKGLKPADFGFYLNAFKYGMPPHGGMGLGMERFVQKMLGLNNVRETVLFPRDRIRLSP